MLIVWIVLGLLAVAGGAWLFVRRRPIGKLGIREGAGIGVEFLIRTRVVTIGSEEGQTVTVSHPRVSRRHAVLHVEDGKFVLRDRSEQGTRVNGMPVKEAVLRSGDLVTLGDSVDLIFTRLG